MDGKLCSEIAETIKYLLFYMSCVMSRYVLLLVRCVDLYDGLYGGGLSETWKHVVASRWGKDECKYGTRRNSTCEITCRNLEYLLDFTVHVIVYSAYVERKRSLFPISDRRVNLNCYMHYAYELTNITAVSYTHLTLPTKA